MIEIVPLTAGQLSEAHSIYSSALIHDSLPLGWFRYKTLEDPDFDPEMTLVARADGQPVGFLMGVCRAADGGVTAGLKVFAVEPGYRNRGIASELLRRIEEAARIRGARSISVGYTRPSYFTAGVDPRYTSACAFLLRRGYERRGEAFNMDVDLESSDWDTAALEERLGEQGVRIARLDEDNRPGLLEFFAREGTSAGWQYQILRAACERPPAVFVAERGGEVIAFACFDGVRPGWFGPMATGERARGLGIGSATYLRCLQAMKALGYGVAVINAVGPLYFYARTSGAVVSRVFWQWSKDLSDPKAI